MKTRFKAACITNADAGSIFPVRENKLEFQYVQNDSLFRGNESNKHIYSNHELEINHQALREGKMLFEWGSKRKTEIKETVGRKSKK
ncbi:MAG: hypothetical protein ABIA63_01425 [bacterium]